jgi:predicted small lipoprotein YifL
MDRMSINQMLDHFCMHSRYFQRILLLLLLLLLASCGQPAPVPFDMPRWHQHAADASPTNPRRSMALDLVQRNTLLGKSRREIVQMLGEPMRDSQTTTLYFFLGQVESGEVVSLAVTFEQDRAVKAVIHTF